MGLMRRPAAITWPGWRHLPREARATLFLLAVIAWTVLPHVGQLPVWCTALTAAVLLWRGALAVRGAVRASGGAGVILIDCLTLLASNVIVPRPEPVTAQAADSALSAEVDELLSTYSESAAEWIIISNDK